MTNSRNKSDAARLMFLAHHRTEYSYGHLSIEVIQLGHYDNAIGRITLTWQSNADSPRDWYGLHIGIDATNSDEFSASAKLAQRILAGQDNECLTPMWALARLAACKIQRAVHDPRTGDRTPIAELPAEDLNAYNDDRASYNAPYFAARVLAHNAREARALIAADLAASPEKLAAWSAAGCRVLEFQRGRPAVLDLADVLPAQQPEPATV